MPAATDRLPLVTLAALFVGYACSYFHRADLATLAPLWAADGVHGDLRAALPDIASLGMFVYACGKLIGGVLAERFGGARTFVAALAGAGAAEFAALHTDAPLPFAICRGLGMVVLGCAWPALGHVVAAVTPRWRLAMVMAFLSQSYLAGDAAVRAVLAAVVANGGGAHAVLATSTAGLLGAAVLVALLFVAARPRRSRGARSATLVAPAPAPANGSLWRLMAALAAMNFGLALVRESLSLWTPTLLVDLCAAPADDAVRASALLPLASSVAAIVAGRWADRGPRAMLAITLWPPLVGALALLVVATGRLSFATMLVLLGLASAGLVMPMTLASGVMPLRAAVAGGARWLGFVDGAGSFGAVLAGGALARVHAAAGPAGLFLTLAGVAAVAAALAVVVHRVSRATG